CALPIYRPGELGVLGEGVGERGGAPPGRERDGPRCAGWLAAQPPRRAEVERSPVGAGQWPGVLGAYLVDVRARLADLQPHPRWCRRVLLAQVTVEEGQLGGACGLGVEGGPLAASVGVGELLRRPHLLEGAEGAP